MINTVCVVNNNNKPITVNGFNWNEPVRAANLSLPTVTGSGSSDELKRLHPSGQATLSGRTTAVRTGGETRLGGSGHTFSSAFFPSFPSSDFSSSANLTRLVLISQVGRSAGESWDNIMKELMQFIQWNCLWLMQTSLHTTPACFRQDQYCLWADRTQWRDSSALKKKKKKLTTFITNICSR